MTVDLDPRPLNLNHEHWEDVVEENYYEPELPSLSTLMQGSTVCTILEADDLFRDSIPC